MVAVRLGLLLAAACWPPPPPACTQIAFADKPGIAKLFIALPMVDKKWTPEEFRAANDRVLFGCDSSYWQGVGNVLAADLSRAQKQKIFFDNYKNLLKKSGRGL